MLSFLFFVYENLVWPLWSILLTYFLLGFKMVILYLGAVFLTFCFSGYFYIFLFFTLYATASTLYFCVCVSLIAYLYYDIQLISELLLYFLNKLEFDVVVIFVCLVHMSLVLALASNYFFKIVLLVLSVSLVGYSYIFFSVNYDIHVTRYFFSPFDNIHDNSIIIFITVYFRIVEITLINVLYFLTYYIYFVPVYLLLAQGLNSYFKPLWMLFLAVSFFYFCAFIYCFITFSPFVSDIFTNTVYSNTYFTITKVLNAVDISQALQLSIEKHAHFKYVLDFDPGLKDLLTLLLKNGDIFKANLLFISLNNTSFVGYLVQNWLTTYLYWVSIYVSWFG